MRCTIQDADSKYLKTGPWEPFPVKRPFVGHELIVVILRKRWEDNIKMGLQEVGRGCWGWMELAQDRDRWRALVSTVMNFRVP